MPKGYSKDRCCITCGRPLGSRNKLGYCIGCRTNELRRVAQTHDTIRPYMAEKVAYYEARAALGLELFAESPWRRLTGAHNRLGEQQMKFAVATGTVAAAHKVE